MVPTTITKITANITAYSAMSWPSSSDQNLLRNLAIFLTLHLWRARAVRFAPARFLDDWHQIAPWTAIQQWPIQAAWFTAVTAGDYSSHLPVEAWRALLVLAWHG
jgi:hypothetical protein